ncbi:MAG: hypothetical protein KF901_18210 [Myxococcales bacterium]|nr:hypothetical protein [Myxococcales bacterium]
MRVMVLGLVAASWGLGCGSDDTSDDGRGDASVADARDDATMDATAPPDATDAVDAAARPDASRRDAGELPALPDLPAEGCEGASLRVVPGAPEVRGPWAVGARTVSVGRLTAEVWYPASSAEGEAARYDLRAWLPPSQRDRITDDENPWQDCDCVRDAPIDAEHGPYPVVVFVHGTAAFRTQSLSILTHWASRGFVVVAADHPGLFLGDQLAVACPDTASGARDIPGDVAALLAALDAPSGELAFLDGRIERARTALAGHSAGGAVASMTSRAGVRAVIGLSSSQAASASEGLLGALFVGANQDRVVRYMQTVNAFGASPDPKWLLGIEGSGHLAPSDLCDLVNDDGEDLVAVAQRRNVCGAMFASFLFDCRDDHIDPEEARVVTRAITTAVLEQTLLCHDRADAIEAIPSRFEAVSELRGPGL